MFFRTLHLKTEEPFSCSVCSAAATVAKPLRREGGREERPDVRVRVKSVEKRTIAEKVTGWGIARQFRDRFAVLTAATKGRVVHLLKQPGDSVEPGCAIVELDSTVAGKNLKEKEAARDSQKASFDGSAVAAPQRRTEQHKMAIERPRWPSKKPDPSWNT